MPNSQCPRCGAFQAMVLQVALPAAFFLLMCLPKYYIPVIPHSAQLTGLAPDIESRWWSGPDPYSGDWRPMFVPIFVMV